MRKHLEVVTFTVAAVGSIVIALLDLFGFLHSESWKWLAERIPTISLLLSGMILAALGGVVTGYPSLRRFLHPNIDSILGPHISDMLEQLSRVLRYKTFDLTDLELYRALYKRTLDTYKGAHFLATSIPSAKFFWKNQSTEQAISTFIRSGGKMTRIFFLSSPDEAKHEEARKILLTQCEAGVQVYTSLVSGVPGPLRRFFLVDTEGRIAWEPSRGPDNTITGIVMTADADTTTSYLRLFRELMNLDCTERYVDTGSFIDLHNSTIQRRLTMSPAVPIDAAAFHDFEYRGWEASVLSYDRFFGPLTQLTIGPLLDGAKVKANMTVLDVATGPGYVAAAATRRGASTTGVDFSEKMLARARAINADQTIDFQLGDAEALSFESDQFNAVVMSFGILHLAQPEQALQEVWRVLKTGGLFGFTVWAKPEEAEGFAVILRAIEVFGNPNVPLPAGPPFFRFSDPIECEQALEKAGFASVSAVKLPLIWRLDSADEVFRAFYEGTARTGGLLRAQTPECLAAIRSAVLKHCDKYSQGGKLSIPMPALVVTATKLQAHSK